MFYRKNQDMEHSIKELSEMALNLGFFSPFLLAQKVKYLKEHESDLRNSFALTAAFLTKACSEKGKRGRNRNEENLC